MNKSPKKSGCIKHPENILFKVSYSAFKNFLILVSSNIFAYVIADTLAVTHFAEYSSVRGGNSFNCFNRSVRIIFYIHCRSAVKVYVLSSNLTVISKLNNKRLRSNKTAFTM